jgi:hypothetical protein
MSSKAANAFSLVANLVSLPLTFFGTAVALRVVGLDNHALTGMALFGTAILLGLSASVLHGMLWVAIEKMYKTNMLCSTFVSTPSGTQAVLLSVSLTLPVAVLPVLRPVRGDIAISGSKRLQ